MTTLSELIPEIGENQKKLIWREIEGLLPKPDTKHGFTDYSYDTIDENLAVHEAVTILIERLKGFIGGIE